MKTYVGTITKLKPNQIFVFGSNTQGRHGKGAAKSAMKWGAKYGNPSGLQGQTYAIITKDLTKRIHPSRTKDQIIQEIQKLYNHAEQNPNLEYLIAYSGNGINLNGYSPNEMAIIFNSMSIPENIIFEAVFYELIKSSNIS